MTRIEVRRHLSREQALIEWGPYARGRFGIRTQRRWLDEHRARDEVVCEHGVDLGRDCSQCRDLAVVES